MAGFNREIYDDRPVDGYNSYLGVLLCQAFDPTMGTLRGNHDFY
jgi:hypothetical protein